MSICSEDGRLLKLINTSRGRQQLHPVVVEVLQVFSQPVVHIHIHGRSASRRQNRHGGRDSEQRDSGVEADEKLLIVASRVDIVLLPLQRCHTHTSCRQAAVASSSRSWTVTLVLAVGGGALPAQLVPTSFRYWAHSFFVSSADISSMPVAFPFLAS